MMKLVVTGNETGGNVESGAFLWLQFEGMDVNIREARNRLTELVKRAETGEEITLYRHGRAVAKLVAIAPTERKLGQAKGQIREIDKEWWKPMTEDEAGAFYRGQY